MHFEHAWLDPASGTAFCLSSGPSKEAVRRVHAKAGHPAEDIYELSAPGRTAAWGSAARNSKHWP